MKKIICSRPQSSATFQHEVMLNEHGVHPLLARLWAARGIDSTANISLELNQLLPPHGPTGLKGIDNAAALLTTAILTQQKILIVADYDCDGATACAVGVRGLRMLGAQVEYLVPNRFDYGYGLTPEIVELALKNRAYRPDLLVTVDNGIASIEGVAHARTNGLPVIITDHHLPGDRLPEAAAIVNPNQPGCPFPSKHLAGVGVMFYVLLAVRAALREHGQFTAATQPRIDSLLDLVALGTVADVVRLDHNNRILVYQGLQRIRRGRMQVGLQALMQIAGRQTHRITAADLGFAIGPRLNAAGRLADMGLGIECLLADDREHALKIATQLDQINQARRQIESEMQASALESLAAIDPDEWSARTSVTLFDPDWHQGVIGIVAGRIKEQMWRPTIAFAMADTQGDTLKGSGRSIPGIHLRDVLDLVSKKVPGCILKFGGHAMAAGLTIVADDLDVFESAFEEAVQTFIANNGNPTVLQATLETDGQLNEEWLQPHIAQLLDDQVWGQGFPAPVFCDQFRVVNQRLLKEKHLKLQLETTNGTRVEGIWFGHADNLPAQTTLAYRLALDEYQGQPRLQIMVEAAA
ncbi:single-stranded-DNA-specific exonuclease RecJ [Parvibium lacunae]|uniref:Single-stranded-DNA-specific exonuclease RecJ n=1 Tax=Parvibium lacunae TaxID=1888893 RepID=A0A368L7X1_9BURK|nr:single-stranded-DNA-specific exonuclease RecJ [Parvibium lacunae]RCS59601.1 single-stranded-DNA-specific exonuclease RecJ [Parvibium lacunae]